MTLIIIITIVVLLALYVISVNNKYVRLKNQSEEAGSALDAHLKQRYDLVPQSGGDGQGLRSHEQKTLTAVIGHATRRSPLRRSRRAMRTRPSPRPCAPSSPSARHTRS